MKTLLIGASSNPERYAFKAAQSLLKHGHEIAMLSLKEGKIQGQNFLTGKPVLEEIDTITMYISAKNQPEYYDYILALKPRRVIFNPGAENAEFEGILEKNNIESVEACTLVMLSIGTF